MVEKSFKGPIADTNPANRTGRHTEKIEAVAKQRQGLRCIDCIHFHPETTSIDHPIVQDEQTGRFRWAEVGECRRLPPVIEMKNFLSPDNPARNNSKRDRTGWGLCPLATFDFWCSAFEAAPKNDDEGA